MEAVGTRSNPNEYKSKQDLTVATCRSGRNHKIRGLLNGIPRSLGFLRSGFIELERGPRRITGKKAAEATATIWEAEKSSNLRSQNSKNCSICRLVGSQATNLLCDRTPVGPTNCLA
ncbi:hypothetical protein B296_00025393 [Ensete ventricosum]|uniref:Uncharacterized protein n=1 Tax=Ensete ventricosum TaxID=4639 RepID=A0A427AC59_ENSVE|nr:hypothetical protein B296_00025393 [Ensete ventricosum]